jgi:WS/DGAT/MGAT family acyltransferase
MRVTSRLRHLAGIDASQLYDERPNRPTHTLKVLLLDSSRPPITVEELREHIASRIELVPVLRERVLPIPGSLFHPVWFDAGQPDLSHHVRSLPDDLLSGDPTLESLASALAGRRLTRDRPLWRVWLSPRTERRPEAVFVQLSHALADGHASARLLEVLFGHDAQTRMREPAGPVTEAPTPRALLASGAVELARLVGQTARQLELPRLPARSKMPDGASAFSGPSVPWGGPLGVRRTVAWSELSVSAVDQLRGEVDATIGEVVLALASGAVSAYFRRRNGLPRRSLTAVVPMRPTDWSDGTRGNFNRHTFVTLATDTDDARERLGRIAGDLRHKRRAVTSASVSSWARWLDYYPLFRAVYVCSVPTVGRLAQRPPASMIVSVVHGPRNELGVAGSRVSRIHSVGVLADHLGLNLTVWSYDGRLSFTVVCCGERAPLASEIARGIPEAFSEFCADRGLDTTA